jgi:hypothetical protein
MSKLQMSGKWVAIIFTTAWATFTLLVIGVVTLVVLEAISYAKDPTAIGSYFGEISRSFNEASE